MLFLLVSCVPNQPSSLPIDEALEARWLDGELNGSSYAEASTILRGNRVGLELRGLEPDSTVRLAFSNNGYESWAEMTVGSNGRIDTRTGEALDGSYQGVDEDGFWWSMDFDPGAWDPDRGFETVDLVVTDEDGEILTSTLDWIEVDPGLSEEPIDVAGAVGRVFIPAGEGPFPAVIVFGGSEGGRSTGVDRAKELASRGFLAVGIAYFAAPGLPEQLLEVPVEYVGEIADWTLSRPDVAGDRLGLWGASRGGEYALLLASELDTVGATVAEVPSAVAWGYDVGSSGFSSWSLGGASYPYVDHDGTMPDVTEQSDGSLLYAYRGTFEDSLSDASPAEVEAATFPVEESVGPILMLSGEDDQVWPSCDLAEIAFARLVDSGHASTHEDEIVCYPGTGHALSRPGLPTTAVNAVWSPTLEVWLANGGDPASTARAWRDRQERIFGFFSTHL